MEFLSNAVEFIKGLDLAGFNELGVLIRFVLAVVCGGLIGIEREHKHRPAGFRTHTIVCIGAAMTTMTGLYLQTLRSISPDNFVADPARLGAQVIAGIGLIGAGTIFVTKHRQVKGLTTAAGLWVTAILGLAIGIGCYAVAIYVTVLILFAELVLSRLDWMLVNNARNMNVYVEICNKDGVSVVMEEIKKFGARISDVEVSRAKTEDGEYRLSAVFVLDLDKKTPHDALMSVISGIEGVGSVEEL